MQDLPFTYSVALSQSVPARYDDHLIRTLSTMRGQYFDQQACATLLAAGDVPLYEVYVNHRPEVPGELVHGTSIVHPGTVGDEYFMTKGHFHAALETAEIYCCMAGDGLMLMETPEGEWSAEELHPGIVLYIPPRWAHRSVNTGKHADLITFFVYPGHAGHDYGSIELHGFRKLIVERQSGWLAVDNPRWLPPEKR